MFLEKVVHAEALTPKCYLNKVALQLYWNRTSAWAFSCKYAPHGRSFVKLWARRDGVKSFQIILMIYLTWQKNLDSKSRKYNWFEMSIIKGLTKTKKQSCIICGMQKIIFLKQITREICNIKQMIKDLHHPKVCYIPLMYKVMMAANEKPLF